MIGKHPVDAELTSGLFIRRRQEDDVAIEGASRAEDMLVEQEHRHQVRREHALVVDRSAAIKESVDDLSTEWIRAPARTFDAHDVHVCEHQDWTLLSRTFQARDQRSARCRWL